MLPALSRTYRVAPLLKVLEECLADARGGPLELGLGHGRAAGVRPAEEERGKSPCGLGDLSREYRGRRVSRSRSDVCLGEVVVAVVVEEKRLSLYYWWRRRRGVESSTRTRRMSQEGYIRPAPTRARLDLPPAPAPGRTAPTPTPATAIATAEARYPCRRYRNPVPGRRGAASASTADSAIDVHPHQGQTLARQKKKTKKLLYSLRRKNRSSSPRVVAAVSFSLSLIRLRMLKGSRLPFFLGLPEAASKGGPLTTDCPDTSISLLDNQSIMLQGAQSPSTSAAPVATDGIDKARRLRRKRKAETQDNERLSKRLSLLNIGTFIPSCPTLPNVPVDPLELTSHATYRAKRL